VLTPRFSRCAAGLAIALFLSLSACGGGGSTTSSDVTTDRDSRAPDGGTPAATSSPDSGTDDPSSSPAADVDVCSLVTVEDVSAAFGEALEISADGPGSCQYVSASNPDLELGIAAREDTEGLGLEGLRAKLEDEYGTAPEQIDVGGTEGLVISVQQEGESGELAATVIDGLIVAVILANGDQAGGREVVTQILELTVGAL
jgi:hypothetical protein